MKRQLIKNPVLDKVTKRFIKRGFQVNGNKLSGTLKIKKIRSYPTGMSWSPFAYEVDIIFEGNLYANCGQGSAWLDSSVLTKEHISKIKVNKFIKKEVKDIVIDSLNLFGIQELKYYDQFVINKVSWV